MLAIKLQRKGKRHQPSYRIVVAEKRSKMGAPPVEDLGSYNPFTKQAIVNKERVSHWLKVGAQPTVTTHNLLVKEGMVSGKAVAIKMKKAAPASAGEAAPKADLVASGDSDPAEAAPAQGGQAGDSTPADLVASGDSPAEEPKEG